jgi:hypothetical protein
MPLYRLGRAVQSGLLRRGDAGGIELVSLAQAFGLHEATCGRIQCRKTPWVRTGDRHSLADQCFGERPCWVERSEATEIAIDNFITSLHLLALH